MKDLNIEALTGYKPKTTFYMDLSIAEPFGKKAIEDTITHAFEEWKCNVIYLTELIMAINWKIWEHFETNAPVATLYQDWYMDLDDYAQKTLKGADLEYYYRTTD